MGTITFLLIVVALISGIGALVLRINANSYLHGSRTTARKERKVAVKKPPGELPVSSRERKYVDWYLENGHKRQNVKPAGPVSQPSAIVGVAFLTNETGPQRHISHG